MPWVAVGMRGGGVHVVDAQKAELIATTGGHGDTPDVGWLSGDGKLLLLVADGKRLTAYRVQPVSSQ